MPRSSAPKEARASSDVETPHVWYSDHGPPGGHATHLYIVHIDIYPMCSLCLSFFWCCFVCVFLLRGFFSPSHQQEKTWMAGMPSDRSIFSSNNWWCHPRFTRFPSVVVERAEPVLAEIRAETFCVPSPQGSWGGLGYKSRSAKPLCRVN